MIGAKIICDSLAPCGRRLTTFELTYPRFIHSELLTHRVFSRNAASSRAIPIEKMIAAIEKDTAMPVWWGKNQAGMQADEEIDDVSKKHALLAWLTARDNAITSARVMTLLGVHKQIVNRLLEPFMYITTIVTATDYGNFFDLRDTWKGPTPGQAQPEFATLASMMRAKYVHSEPNILAAGEWHTPYVNTEDLYDPTFVSRFNPVVASAPMGAGIQLISSARCARVSYLTHDGTRDYSKDLELAAKLLPSRHDSPFEHVAMALATDTRSGNFSGFQQFRKIIEARRGCNA